MKKRLLGIISSIVTIIIVVLMLATVSLTASSVSFTIVPDPEIDVVLASRETSLNMSNFERDVLNALATQGVNTSKVKVTTVQTKNQQLDESGASQIKSTWECATIPGTSGSSATQDDFFISGNRLIRSQAGSDRPASGYYCKDAFDTGDATFEFEYGIDSTNYGDFSHGEAGFLFKMQDSSNFYGYIMDNHSACGNIRYDYTEALVRVSNGNFTVLDTNSFPQFSAGLRQQIRIVLEGNNIKVYRNNSLVFNLNDSTYSKGSYGFYVWDQYGAYFADISMETEVQRDFYSIIQEPAWRDNAIHAIVNVSDQTDPSLEDINTYSELLTKTINENIHFIAWGNSNNKTQFTNFISSNNNNGTFLNNSNYTQCINQTAAYIKSLIDEIEQKDNYLILDDQIKINMSPPEAANNTADSTYPYGKWKIEHAYDYFENHIGQFAQSGRYIDDFVTEFDKTGKYDITYADSTVVPGEIYVHRRPTALIKSSKSGNSINLISNSYDLDATSNGNNGIAEEEWKYKKKDEDTWTTGKLTSLTDNTDYVIQLSVKDYQGVWSYPVSIYATNRSEARPVAIFGIKNREATRYEELEVIDTSYDPYGGTITSWTWEVYKGDQKIYTGSTPLTKYNELGEYTMSLTVKNNRGLTSQTYSRKFEIIEDNIPPSVTIEPLSCTWTQSVDVKLEFYDDGGSGFKHYKYAITDSQATPSRAL